MKKFLIHFAALAVLLAGASGCGRRESESAVRRAIEAHLRQRSNLVMSNMSIEFREIKVSADTAEAEVRFESKETSELAVNIRYVLRKTGDRWEVTSSSPVGGSGTHGVPSREGQTTSPETNPHSSSLPPQPSH